MPRNRVKVVEITRTTTKVATSNYKSFSERKHLSETSELEPEVLKNLGEVEKIREIIYCR